MMILLEDYPLQMLLAGLLILLFNGIVTIAISRDDGLSPPQKFAQILIVWILPFIGSLAMLALIGSYDTQDEMKSMVPFPFYLAGYRDPKTPNPFDHHGTEGSCGGGAGFSGDGD